MKADPMLTVSSVAFGLSALALIFAPVEVISMLGAGAAPAGVWVAQLLGAALFGFAELNWMQRYSKVGGIFGRPLLVANLAFTTIGAFASVRTWRNEMGRVEVLVAALVLGTLAAWYARRMFAPARES